MSRAPSGPSRSGDRGEGEAPSRARRQLRQTGRRVRGTLLELKLRIRKQLEAEEDNRYRREVDEKIIDTIIEANPFEVPEVMVENYLDSLIEEDRHHRGQSAADPAREQEIREMFRTPRCG